MAVAILDITDGNLQLWNEDTHLQSPGYALLEGKQYLFGNDARAAARLRPRDINTRYWWQLSTESLQPALGPARHTGDLVHAQLQHMHREGGQPGEILLAVSGSMQRDQMALLLGITQQCPFAAVGLVNRSVALGSLYPGTERLFHLEIQLHQAVLTALTQGNGRVELHRTVPLPGCGLLQLQEKLVEIVAADFIRQTRFDPRRKATTEQQLYDALPEVLRALRTDTETNVEVSGYRARVIRGELLAASQRLLDSLPAALGILRPDDQVIVDPVASLLPGLKEKLPQLQVLAPDSIRLALEQHRDQLVQREQALTYVTTLACLQPRGSAAAPRQEPAQPAAPQPTATPTTGTVTDILAQPAATHLLENHRARPLAAAGTPLEQGWELHRGDAGWQLRGAGAPVAVNGRQYRPGQVLRCGDTIRIGEGVAAQLIEVAPQGA